MRKYLSIFLALVFVFYVVSLNINSAGAQSAPSALFPATVKSILGTDYKNRPFPQASEVPAGLRFVGRYHDTGSSAGCFADFSTGYYWPCLNGFDSKIIETPTRLLTRMTATLVGWNKNDFISRLESEPLSYFKGTRTTQGKYVDALLPWSTFFHHLDPANGLNILFGESRFPITGVDTDDRGYIYYAFNNLWSGGPVILRDDGTNLKGVTQIMGSAKYVPAAGQEYATYLKKATSGAIKIVAVEGADETAPTLIKSGSNYYLFQDKVVIDVTEVSDPKFFRSTEKIYGKIIQSGSMVAVLDLYSIKIYDAADFVNGMSPKETFAGTKTGAQYKGLAVDKATGRFFSIYYDKQPEIPNSSAWDTYTPPKTYISVFSGSGANITETKHEISLGGSGAGRQATQPFLANDLQYNGGYLVAVGRAPNKFGNVGVASINNDIKVWSFASGQPVEFGAPLLRTYYGTYTHPSGFISEGQIQSASVHVLGGKAYLFVNTFNYGDVYEITPTSGSTTTGCTAGNSAPSNAGNTTFPSGEYSYCVNTSKGPITAFYKFGPPIKDLILAQQNLATHIGNKFKNIVWIPSGIPSGGGPAGRWNISDPWNPKDGGVAGLASGGSALAVGTQPAAHKGPFSTGVYPHGPSPGSSHPGVLGELANGQGRFVFEFGTESNSVDGERTLTPILSLAPGQGTSLSQLFEKPIIDIDGLITEHGGQTVIDATASGKFFVYSGGGKRSGSEPNAQPRALEIYDATNLTGSVSYGSATLKPFSSEPWQNITELQIVEVPGVRNHFLIARSSEQYASVTAKPVFYIGEIDADTGSIIRQNSFILDIQVGETFAKKYNGHQKVHLGSGLQSASVNGKTYIFMNEKLIFTGYYDASTLTIAAYQFDPQNLAFIRKGDVALKNTPRVPLGQNIGRDVYFQIAWTENGDAYPMLAAWSKYKEPIIIKGTNSKGGATSISTPQLYSIDLYGLKDIIDSSTPLSITPATADVSIPEDEYVRPLSIGQVELAHYGGDVSSIAGGSPYNLFLKKESGKTNLYLYRKAFVFDGRAYGGSGGTYHTVKAGTDAFGDAGHYYSGITGPATLRVDKIDVSGFTGSSVAPTTTDNGCTTGSTFSTTTGKPCACVLNPTFAMGTKSEAVKAFQQQLKDAKLYFGNVDGTYGPLTRAADLAYCISKLYIGPVAPVGSTPVISAISGPTSLGVNTLGTWTVSAADGNKDDLSWSVNFGEGKSVMTCKVNPPVGTSQGWSYSASHSWAQTGTYTVTFYTNDCKGGSADKSITVNVSGSGGEGGIDGGGVNQNY